MNENTGKHAAVNGLEMYYEIHGEGEPLILLHGGVGAMDGTPRSSRGWTRWAPLPRSR